MNNKAVRYIVIAEVLVCFVPLAGLLFLGILFTPFAMQEVLAGRLAGALHLVTVVCGVAGLIALVQVIKWILGRRAGLLGRRWTLALMLLGLLPVALIFMDAAFDGRPPWYMVPVWAAPIAVTAHLAWLARQYLFTSAESGVGP